LGDEKGKILKMNVETLLGNQFLQKHVIQCKNMAMLGKKSKKKKK